MVRTLVMAVSVMALSAGPALAQAPAGSCQDNINQLKAATSNRLDYSANAAKDKIAVAEQLLKDNKPAECIVKTQEAANDIQLTLKK